VATIDEVAGGTLGSINTAALNANIFLPALTAQIDASISLGLGPTKFDLSTQLNAALSAQATLVLQVSDPLAALRTAIAAVAQLQANLTAALQLPTVSLSLSAEIGATAALAAALTAKLGILEGVISAALAVKIPATNFSTGLGNALGVGPAILLAFNGIGDATTMAAIGSLIQAKLSAPVNFGPDTINPGDFTSGILLLTTASPVFTAMSVLFAGL
jgi:Mrp family chromosome partitioning ATPase